jgi:hypothetical protein
VDILVFLDTVVSVNLELQVILERLVTQVNQALVDIQVSQARAVIQGKVAFQVILELASLELVAIQDKVARQVTAVSLGLLDILDKAERLDIVVDRELAATQAILAHLDIAVSLELVAIQVIVE